MSRVIRLRNGQTFVLDGIRDLEGLVEPEIYEAITYFIEKMKSEEEENINEEVNDLDKDNDDLRDDIESLESEKESLESSLREIKEITEELIEGIHNSGKTDESEIIIELNHIGGIIYNAI